MMSLGPTGGSVYVEGISDLNALNKFRSNVYFVAADSVDPVLDYKTARNELGAHNKTLLEKPEYILINKKDLVSPEIIAKIAEKFKEFNKNVTSISVLDMDSIELVKKILNGLILKKTHKKASAPGAEQRKQGQRP